MRGTGTGTSGTGINAWVLLNFRVASYLMKGTLVKKLIALLIMLPLAACNNQPSDVADTLAKPAALPAGITLVEEFKGDDSGIAIPYAKYRLANGLTVVLHEDHSDPLAHVDVTYHVGSNREEIGRSGFAHFFEHMMFQGSANVGDEEHF